LTGDGPALTLAGATAGKEDAAMTAHASHPPYTCPICGQSRSPQTIVHGEMIRSAVADLIHRDHPEWDGRAPVCLQCLQHFRTEYVEDVLEDERGELSAIDKDVLDSFKEQDLLAANLNAEFDSSLTTGQRVADAVATFGGSWTFIGIFGAVLVVWMAINTIILMHRPFDPYPFILLNLVLSCLAAIQAPVIMMSQNRQESKDRLRSENDYRVNLKAELEIRHLNEKMDLLLTRQWQRLLEIQRIQVELMEEMTRKR
jgi:uncharacterized membrane protein